MYFWLCIITHQFVFNNIRLFIICLVYHLVFRLSVLWIYIYIFFSFGFLHATYPLHSIFSEEELIVHNWILKYTIIIIIKRESCNMDHGSLSCSISLIITAFLLSYTCVCSTLDPLDLLRLCFLDLRICPPPLSSYPISSFTTSERNGRSIMERL